MRSLSTRTKAYEVAMHKNNDKRGCYKLEQSQKRMLSTKTKANEDAKHNNNGK